MGIVNLIKGLDLQKDIYNFNGSIKDNLHLNWEYVKIYKASQELNPDYDVQDDDVITVQEFPQGLTAMVVTAIVVGVIAIGVGVGAAIWAYNQAKKARAEMEDALKRIGKSNKQRDVSSIPQLSGARNERADGKNPPILIGRHLFTPYFLSDPYIRPFGTDGKDLYWYGTFLSGQNGICFEKIRNGLNDLLTLSGNAAQKGKFSFDRPANYNPADPPPFYDPENFIEIVQEGYSFTESVFEQKWVDSLDSTVEIGRKKKDGAQVVDDLYMDDDGAEPVVRETARFPMRAEIEVFIDGLHGWDSENGVETNATVGIQIEWSADMNGWSSIPITNFNGNYITRARAEQMRFLAEVNFPASVFSKEGKPVYIRATRLTRMYSGGYRDRVYLGAIRTKQYNPKKSSTMNLVAARNLNERLENKFCRIGIKIKANRNTQDALDRFNIIASMTARTWNNGWSTGKSKTSNPAAVALEILTGLIHEPSKYNDREINLDSFGKLYEYCNNREVKIAGEGIRKFNLEANGVVSNSARKVDVLKSVLAVCDAGLYINEFGKLYVYYDHFQSTPIALLNKQRIVKMSEQRSLDPRPDGYTVEFINEDSDWSIDTHRILRPRIEADPGKNTWTSIKLDYTTNYYQAMWHARRMMAKEIHRPGEIKTTVGKEGRLYKPGSLIKVQHEGFKIGLGSGEITEVIKKGDLILGFRLMEKFDIASDRDYFVEYYVVSESQNHVVYPLPEVAGKPESKIRTMKLQSVGKYTNTLMFSTPLPADEFYTPEFGNILSVIYGEPTGIQGKVWESKRYLVTELSEISDGYDLTLVPYSDVIYETTSIDEIPVYQSSIMNAPPRVYNDANDRQTILEGRIPEIREINEISTIIVGTKTPGYRGATNTPDLNNTGIINGNRMNVGDWIAYTGISGAWEYGFCYQWNGKEWFKLEVNADNMGKYTIAISDLVKGAPNGYFSILFCRTLVTVDAFIQNLYMQQGTMTNGGVLQSANYNPVTQTGWMIKYNGEAFFQGVHIDADSITVNGKGYLPLHFVYFQLPQQVAPNGTFAGYWENVSFRYPGLFMRIQGGNAAPFGQQQNERVGQHTHPISNGTVVTGWEYDAAGAAPALLTSIGLKKESVETSFRGHNDWIEENRPKNITIIVWEKTRNA